MYIISESSQLVGLKLVRRTLVEQTTYRPLLILIGTMAVRKWDFRSILDLRPDSNGFTCVGTIKTGKEKGKPCGQVKQFMGYDRLKKAAELLDDMDNASSLKVVYQDLEQLADLCMCWQKHREIQTKEVVERWKTRIYESELGDEAEPIAQREVVAPLKATKEPAHLYGAVKETTVPPQERNQNKVRNLSESHILVLTLLFTVSTHRKGTIVVEGHQHEYLKSP